MENPNEILLKPNMFSFFYKDLEYDTIFSG